MMDICECKAKDKPHICGNVLYLPAGHYWINWDLIKTVKVGDEITFEKISDG